MQWGVDYKIYNKPRRIVLLEFFDVTGLRLRFLFRRLYG